MRKTKRRSTSLVLPASRAQALDIEAHDDEMLQLAAGWQIVKLEIGPLEFFDQPIVTADYIQVGKIELDPLAYRRKERDYVILDGAERTSRFWKAAPNGSALLDVLIRCRKYYVDSATDQVDIDDEKAGLLVKEECLRKLGGGDDYIVLPEQLLGH